MGDRRRILPSSPGCVLGAAHLLAVLVTLTTCTSAAESHGRDASFERGRRDIPDLALTFDGGSDAGQSERILDALEERGITATFFLTGEFITLNPRIVQRIAQGGHEVGNHTWSHPHLTSWSRNRRHETLPGLDRAFLQGELARTAKAYEAVTGRRLAPLWRAPYGEVNDDLLLWGEDAGWCHVGWTRDDRGGRHSLDSLDWVSERSSRDYLTSRQIAERILSFGGGDRLNGGIVLMHLSTRREDPGSVRLGELIDALRNDGYRLVTVTELQRTAAFPPPITAALSPAGD